MKTPIEKILEAIEKLMQPPKAEPPKPREFAPVVCNICHTAENLEPASVTEVFLRLVPKIKELAREPIEHICDDCLQRFINVKAVFTFYNPMTKRTTVIARQTFPLNKKLIEQFIEQVKQLPEHVKYKVMFTASKELKSEIRRRRRQKLTELVIGDRINRLYEGFERPKKPTKRKRFDFTPSIEDIVSVIKGEKMPRPKVTIGCGDCEKAVCPKDCPRYALAKQLEIFKGTKLVLTDDYDLSQYYEEDESLRQLFGE